MKLKVLIGVIAFISLTGCGAAANEHGKDAPVEGRDTSPASVGNMPDGFSNFSYKCVGTDMVYTLFHNKNNYGSIAVSPNNPACSGGGLSDSVPSN